MPTLSDITAALRKPVHSLRQRILGSQNKRVQLVIETVRQTIRDDVTLMAAGVAYYAVLSLFPLTLLLLAVLRLFSSAESSRQNLESFFSIYVPDSGAFVDQITGQAVGVTSLLGAIGFVGILWSGTAMISALTKAVNRAFGIHRDLPFYRDKPLSILLGMGVMLAFAASLFGTAAIEALSRLDIPVIGRLTWVQVVARLLPYAVTAATFGLVYKLLPQTITRWKDVVPVALLGAVFFQLAQVFFVFYLHRFGRFEIYGSMSLLVVTMVWCYYSAIVVLVGAEVVAIKSNGQEHHVLKDPSPVL